MTSLLMGITALVLNTSANEARDFWDHWVGDLSGKGSFVVLTDGDHSIGAVGIHYPGSLSGDCGLRIRHSSRFARLKEIARDLEFSAYLYRGAVDVDVTDTSIDVRAAYGRTNFYMDLIAVRARSGIPLRTLAEQHGFRSHHLIAEALPCRN